MYWRSLLALATVVATPHQPSGDYDRTLRVGGALRHYVVHLPPATEGRRLPVVLLLHGSGGTGRQVAAATGFAAEADLRGFVAVYPDGQGGDWNDGRTADGPDDVAFVRALLDTLARSIRIQPRRVYAAGISSGGIFAHRLACELPGRLAAIAVVAGGMPPAVAARCGAVPPVALIAFNGTEDQLIPYAGGDLLSAGESPALWAGVDHCTPDPRTVPLADRAGGDSTTVRRTTWPRCDPGTDVVLYTISGGGHSWPGSAPMRVPLLGRTTQDLSATRTIGAFFAAHARPVPAAAH